jgi:hypothetical protein
VCSFRYSAETETKELTDWKLKTILDGIEKQIAPKKKDMPQALYERFDSY